MGQVLAGLPVRVVGPDRLQVGEAMALASPSAVRTTSRSVLTSTLRDICPAPER